MKREALNVGDKVVMVNCLEAEKYKDKVWIVRSNPWILCGTEVVLLEDYSGGFSTKCLKKVK